LSLMSSRSSHSFKELGITEAEAHMSHQMVHEHATPLFEVSNITVSEVFEILIHDLSGENDVPGDRFTGKRCILLCERHQMTGNTQMNDSRSRSWRSLFN